MDFGSLVSLFQGEPQAGSLVRNTEQTPVSSVRSVFTSSGAEGLQSIELVPRDRATPVSLRGQGPGGLAGGMAVPAGRGEGEGFRKHSVF